MWIIWYIDICVKLNISESMWLKASLFAFDCGMPDSYLQRNSNQTPEPTYINDAGKRDVHVPLQHQLGHQLGIHDVQIVWVEEV